MSNAKYDTHQVTNASKIARQQNKGVIAKGVSELEGTGLSATTDVPIPWCIKISRVNKELTQILKEHTFYSAPIQGLSQDGIVVQKTAITLDQKERHGEFRDYCNKLIDCLQDYEDLNEAMGLEGIVNEHLKDVDSIIEKQGEYLEETFMQCRMNMLHLKLTQAIKEAGLMVG